MSDEISNLFQSLPGPEDVRRWEEECVRMDEAIADLTARRNRVGQLIAFARHLFEQGNASEALKKIEEVASEAEAASKAPAASKTAKRPRARGKETWRAAIEVIVKAHPEGISYDKIKQMVPEKLKKQLEEFPEAKGFYTALRKLDEAKVIVRRNGVAFTRKGYAAYQEKLAKGETEDITVIRRESPMAEAIKAFLRGSGPSKGTAIRAFLMGVPELAGPVLRNSSAMYNVLLRLKERGEILHDVDAATYSVPQENGAPANAGAPDTGRAATLPFENVIGFPPSR